MKIDMPKTEREWERLASGWARAHRGMAGMGVNELSPRLAELGVRQEASNISGKLASGRFAATFLLQVLIAAGTPDLELRVRDRSLPATEGEVEPDGAAPEVSQ